MEWTILHLYPELMSLYGEYANLSVLSRLLEDLGDTVTVRTATFEDTPDFSGADLIYMGAGTERSQKAVLTDLARHAGKLKEAVERGTLLLFTGNAMETLGASVTDAAGKEWPGLGLAGFTTAETNRRSPGDVIASPALWEGPVVGFMNKCSATSGVETPLFSALPLGFGNEAEGGAEGYAAGNILATHITGPVLVKNPAFLQYVAGRLYGSRGKDLPALPEDAPWRVHARRAYEVTCAELSARLGK